MNVFWDPPPKYPKSVPCGATFSLTDDAGNNIKDGDSICIKIISSSLLLKYPRVFATGDFYQWLVVMPLGCHAVADVIIINTMYCYCRDH